MYGMEIASRCTSARADLEYVCVLVLGPAEDRPLVNAASCVSGSYDGQGAVACV